MSYQGSSIRRLPALMAVIILCLGATPLLADYTPDPSAPRADIPTQYQWSKTDLFPDQAAWEAELAAIQQDIPKLTRFRGRLAEGPQVLLESQNEIQSLLTRFMKLRTYSAALFDTDMGVGDYRTMAGQVAQLGPKFSEATSWMEPELLSIDPEKIRGWMAANEELAGYRYEFEEMWRQQAHTLSAAEERILALTGNVRGVPMEASETLLSVDMKFGNIIDEQGREVPVTLSGWSGLRSSDVYNVRKQATDAFFAGLRQYDDTFATLLDGTVKSHILSKDARGYDSCLEAALSPDNISPKAYRMLIDTVRENLPRTMHKYVALRRKVMGLEGPLTFPNLNNNMIEGAEPEYTYEEGCKIIAAALRPLGKEYVALIKEGMDPANGWIDVYPNANKRSGAYSNGSLAADVHPYVLHNFDNSLDAVSTTAHEFGHALHSVYSSRNQPPQYRSYTTFLAEIASTCNEALLTDYMLRQADDIDTKLILLNQRLESIRQTIFRQTLFADFELRFHEQAETGSPLTADFLNQTYGDLIREYYGPEFEMGPNDECEWVFIPHFYYNFYVFTYATGLTSGLTIADLIEKDGRKAADRYIDNMLSAGCSAPPLDILRSAGVDLETPRPILAAMDLFEKTVEQFDKLWTKKYGRK
ncbi:oligoendopeptidase F [bacterium DOLJORAL78_65_58]|nr:MAG: oligoendopeptidase F [bacterium DOLZORAL124_64_63]PIE76603.1 MAG: oligoendopeptidase F [bacterium DOLJORAL78_65_58]